MLRINLMILFSFLFLMLSTTAATLHAQSGGDAANFSSPFAPGHSITISEGPFCDNRYHTHTTQPAVDMPSGSQYNVPIYAIYDGEVVFAGRDTSGFGNRIETHSNDGYEIIYGHTSVFETDIQNQIGEFIVTVGQNVTQGQLIGFLGSSGNSSGPHLHLAIHQNGRERSDLIKSFSWLHWRRNPQTNQDEYCGGGGTVEGQAVDEPACNDRNYNGIIWFHQRYCQNKITETTQIGSHVGLSDVSSIYVGSGWSARVYDAAGNWQCINRSLWNMNKDYFSSTGQRMEDAVVKIVVLHNSNCNGEVDPYLAENSTGGDATAIGGSVGSDQKVTIYSLANYAGTVTWVGSQGFSNSPKADSYSFDMPSGWSVKIWRGNDRSGEQRCFSSSVHNLQDHGWHLAIESIEVFNTNVCGDAQTGYAVLCGEGGCWQFGTGYHSLPGYGDGWNDMLTQIYAVPSNMSVMLFREGQRRGTVECANAPRNSLPSGWPHDLYKQITDVYVATAQGCPASQHGAVILYDGRNFEGYSWSAGVDPVTVNMSNLGSREYYNDTAESVRIPPGKSAIFYVDDSRGGERTDCWTGDHSDFGNLNNKISSVEIFLNTTCQPPIPQPPINLVMSNSNESSITLAWTDQAESENGFNIYKWNGSGFPLIATTGSNTTSYTDVGLPCSSDQFYKVTAFNNSGNSVEAGWVQMRTTACVSIPLVQAKDPFDGSMFHQGETVTFKWDKLTDKTYTYYISVIPMGSESSVANLEAYDTDSINFNTAEFSPNLYVWFIVASPDGGKNLGSVMAYNDFWVTEPANNPTMPSAPINFRHTITGTTSLTLSWDDTSSNELGFHIYRWTGPEQNTWPLIATVGANVTSFVHDVGCGYGGFYKITAYNEKGDSPATNWIVAHSQDCIQEDLCPQTSVTVAKFFEHWKCIGFSLDVTALQDYPTLQPPYNDAFSSIKVAPGYSVMVYANENFQGPSLCFSEDFGDFYYTGMTFSDGVTALSDAISSFKVYHNTSCSVQPVAPTLLSPANRTELQQNQMVEFKWEGGVADSHIYNIRSTATGAVDSMGASDNHFVLFTQRPGQYEWYITSIIGDNQAESERWSFIIKESSQPPPPENRLYLPMVRK